MPETGGALEPRITELFGAPRATDRGSGSSCCYCVYVGGKRLRLNVNSSTSRGARERSKRPLHPRDAWLFVGDRNPEPPNGRFATINFQ